MKAILVGNEICERFIRPLATLLFVTIGALVSNVGLSMLFAVLLQVSLFVFAILRFGMFASVVALFIYGVTYGGLITIDPSRFYFAHGMVCVGVILGLAALGCVSALGGWQKTLRPQRF